jgi:sugar lactone lactonase YvrE
VALIITVVSMTVVLLAAAGVGGWYLTRLTAVDTEPPKAGWTPTVILVAGTGSDDRVDGPAFDARFSEPYAAAAAADGTIYVADAGASNAIRKISADGVVSTIAGGVEGFADGPGAEARFNTPSGIAVDAAGTVYVADTGNHAIRHIAPDGTVTTIAGNGSPGWRDGRGSDARFDGPMGLALGPRGLLVADAYNDRIRLVSADGTVSTIAGSVPGLADGLGSAAMFDTPTGVAIDPRGVAFVADTGNDLLRRVSPDGAVTTVQTIDLTGTPSPLSRPIGIGATLDGRLYLTDRRARVLEIAPEGAMRVLAGGTPGFANGLGAAARFRNPAGLAVRADGAVILADAGNRMIRRLERPERLADAAPAPPVVHTGFDLARFAGTPLVWPTEPQDQAQEVAGTMGEARGNAGGEGRERFHAGVDIHANEGEPVLAVRDGKIDQPMATGGFGTLSEYLSVGPVTYVHLRVGRDRRNTPLDPEQMPLVSDPTGAPVRVRVRRGTRIHAGEIIGTVNRFQHVHLNVGPPGEEANPLLVGLPGFVDTVPPKISPRGIELLDLTGQPITTREHGRVLVSAPVQIVVDAFDQVNGNKPTRRLGVFKVGYQVLDSRGGPIQGVSEPRETLQFDRLPSDPDAPRLIYAPGSGIPFYGTRRTRFRYVVTASIEDGHVVNEPWDPTNLPPGNYVLRVIVKDAAGNQALGGRDLPVAIRH